MSRSENLGPSKRKRAQQTYLDKNEKVIPMFHYNSMIGNFLEREDACMYIDNRHGVVLLSARRAKSPEGIGIRWLVF